MSTTINTDSYEPAGFLDCPLGQLKVTAEFCQKSEALGFKTIREMTEPGWGKLLRMDGFCYDWFNELVRLLSSRGLLSLLETPGMR